MMHSQNHADEGWDPNAGSRSGEPNGKERLWAEPHLDLSSFMEAWGLVECLASAIVVSLFCF